MLKSGETGKLKTQCIILIYNNYEKKKKQNK